MKKQEKIRMEDGIYPNQDFDIYTRIDAVNFSSLKNIESHSLFHYVNWLGKEKSTSALDFGRMLHQYIFEKEEFTEKNKPFPSDNPEKYYFLFKDKKDLEKVKKQEQDGNLEHGARLFAKRVNAYFARKGVSLISSFEGYKMREIEKRLKENPITNKLIYSGDPKREMTIVWTDPDTGVQCKGRVDNYNYGFELDLKSSKDARPSRYEWDIKKYYYHVQRAFYGDGLVENGLEHKAGMIAAVEKDLPFYVQPYQFNKNGSAMNKGRYIYKKCLEKIADFKENGAEALEGYIDPDESNKNRKHVVIFDL